MEDRIRKAPVPGDVQDVLANSSREIFAATGRKLRKNPNAIIS